MRPAGARVFILETQESVSRLAGGRVARAVPPKLQTALLLSTTRMEIPKFSSCLYTSRGKISKKFFPAVAGLFFLETHVSVLVFWFWPGPPNLKNSLPVFILEGSKPEQRGGWTGGSSGESAGALTRLLGMVFGPN